MKNSVINLKTQNFKIKIEETLSRIIEVNASSIEEAEDIVRKQYSDEEIVLDYEDFDEYNIYQIPTELTQ